MRRAVPAFRVVVRPSRGWLAWVAVNGLVLAVLLPWHVSPWVALVVPALSWGALAADGWPHAGVRTVFRFDPCSGRAWRETADGDAAIDVLGESVAWPWLIVLRYREAGRRRARLLLPDSAPADALRRLRVFLRWAPDPATLTQD